MRFMRSALPVLLLLVVMALPVAAQAPVIEYYHVDALGSVRAVTDATGAVVRTHHYHPFGEGVGVESGSDPLRFTGKPRDAETGLDYFGARYYAQRTARFTAVDPVMGTELALVDPQRWNRYAYVGNRPTRLVDPDGRNWIAVLHRAASHPMVQRAQSAIANQGARAWMALTRLFNTPAGQELVQTATELATGSDSGPMSSVPSIGAVIGHHSADYVGVGRRLGVAVNDLGLYYDRMPKDQQDAALKSFLDGIIGKGLNVLVATENGIVRRFSPLEWEVNYLRANGYRWSDDNRILLAPSK